MTEQELTKKIAVYRKEIKSLNKRLQLCVNAIDKITEIPDDEIYTEKLDIVLEKIKDIVFELKYRRLSILAMNNALKIINSN